MPPSSNKVTQIDYDYIFGRATAETSYSLTEQQVALILAVSEQWHWLTRWNLFAPTSTQSDTVDALVSDLESRLTAEGPVGPIGNAPFWDDAKPDPAENARHAAYHDAEIVGAAPVFRGFGCAGRGGVVSDNRATFPAVLQNRQSWRHHPNPFG